MKRSKQTSMGNKASVAIFSKKAEYPDKRSSCPEVPDEVFEAALRVSETNTCELVRTGTGFYIIAHSPTGPSSKPEGWNGWLPVYVAKVREWSSGGIRESEMQAYIDQRTGELK